ncbi:MAG: hypothetical protein J6Y78_00270 [Paludibacteraceae bacterium]|nr:hypothetical protein [Paludibacteraceae bacterium]
MSKVFVHLSSSHKDAKYEMSCLRGYENNVIKIDWNKLYVTLKNGDTHYFMSSYKYSQWCKGRTYFIGNKQYHSGYEMKVGE